MMIIKDELQQAHDDLAQMGWPTVAELEKMQEREQIKRGKQLTERRRQAEMERELKQWLD